MKTEQIIKTLQEYNDWRRSRGKWEIGSIFDTITAHEIGLTIDAAIEKLQTLEKERDEARKFAETERLHSWKISSHKSGWVNFPWEESSK